MYLMLQLASDWKYSNLSYNILKVQELNQFFAEICVSFKRTWINLGE